MPTKTIKVCLVTLTLAALTLGAPGVALSASVSNAAQDPAECCSKSGCNDCCGEAESNRCEEEFPEASLLPFHDAGCPIHGDALPLSPGITENLSLAGTALPISLVPTRPPARSPPQSTPSV